MADAKPRRKVTLQRKLGGGFKNKDEMYDAGEGSIPGSRKYVDSLTIPDDREDADATAVNPRKRKVSDRPANNDFVDDVNYAPAEKAAKEADAKREGVARRLLNLKRK